MMFEFNEVLTAIVSAILAIPTAYVTARRHTRKVLTERLDKISGGRVSSLERLVAVALTEHRLRTETPIAVYGRESRWADLREGGFASAHWVGSDVPTPPCDVAVVEADTVPGDQIATLGETYVLLYKEDAPYKGPKPPGAQVTFANSSITLDARLMEALRHRDARSRGGS